MSFNQSESSDKASISEGLATSNREYSSSKQGVGVTSERYHRSSRERHSSKDRHRAASRDHRSRRDRRSSRERGHRDEQPSREDRHHRSRSSRDRDYHRDDRRRSHRDSDRKSSKKDKKEKKEKRVIVGDLNSQYGAYGILKDHDIHTKQLEFSAWLREVKGIDRSSMGGKYQERNLFDEFKEDYNTATLPHVKFYDLDKWESSVSRDDGSVDVAPKESDEVILQRERLQSRKEEAERRNQGVMSAVQERVRRAKLSKSDEYTQLQSELYRNMTKKSTFESLAKQREDEQAKRSDSGKYR